MVSLRVQDMQQLREHAESIKDVVDDLEWMVETTPDDKAIFGVDRALRQARELLATLKSATA
jgi:hypothetical protein